MKHSRLNFLKIICVSLSLILVNTTLAQSYKIVDTGQQTFYGNSTVISTPSSGESFYGQDAQYSGNEPSYTDNNDGIITDNVTGLMWAKSCDLNGDGKINVDDKIS